jgi:hypothetical protein
MASYFFNVPPSRPPMRVLPYEAPQQGRNYWVFDDVLADPVGLRQRCLASKDWILGFPFRQESWPGRRTMPALEPDELAGIERVVRDATGVPRLWVETAPGGATLNHNCAQSAGAGCAHPRPHTDSLQLCRYAGVLYLTPDAPEHAGTSFYRQRLPDGSLGGNQVRPPHRNLVDALGTRFVPPDSFVEDVRVPNRFNRLLVYRANMIHSASAYFGATPADERLTAVFFWMA